MLLAVSAWAERGTVYISWKGATPEQRRTIRNVLATPETVYETAHLVNDALSDALGINLSTINTSRALAWRAVAGSEAHRLLVHVEWQETTMTVRKRTTVEHEDPLPKLKDLLLQRFTTTKRRSGFLGEQTPMPELGVIIESEQAISRGVMDKDYFQKIVRARVDLDYQPGNLVASDISPVPWHLDRIDQIAWPPASNTYPNFPIGGHRDVTVAIVDSGVDPTHPDLQGRVQTLRYGGQYDNLPRDSDYHGTHVSGIVGGPETGVARQLDGLTLLDVRVLDADGNGDFSNLIEGLMAIVDYCTLVLSQRPDAQFIINMSLGGGASPTDISGARAELDLALQLCNATAVAAAGNDNSGTNTFYPAMIQGVIGVGASTTMDRKASFSNWNTVVDIFAPGVDILSTVPLKYASSGLGYLSGTSMASPVVAGALAVLTTQCPRTTRMECRQQRFADAAIPTGMVTVPASTTRRLIYLGSSSSSTPGVPSPTRQVPSDAVTVLAYFSGAYILAVLLLLALFCL